MTHKGTPHCAPAPTVVLVITSIKRSASYFGLLLVLATVSKAPLAVAQTQAPQAALIVTRGEGAQDCPESTALADRVRAVAGANVVNAEPGTAAFQTWVQVAIARNFNGYSAQISTSGVRHGSRTLEDVGPSCANLADAIAVTLAIILDPYASAPPPRAVRPAEVPTRPTSPPKKPPGNAPLPSRFFLAASGGVTLNVLDHAMPLLTATAGLRLSTNWALLLGGGYVFTDTVSSAGGEVELSLAYVDFGVCGRALGESGGAQLNWCLSTMLGPLRGSGHGYDDEFSKSSPWFAVGVGPEVEFPIARSFSWILTADAVLPLVRNGFDVQTGGSRSPAFRPSSVAALVSLGVRGDL